MEPEQDHAYSIPFREGHDFTEVQIKGENDPVLSDGLLENLPIGQFVKIFFAQMFGVMPFLPQPFGHTQRDTHVG